MVLKTPNQTDQTCICYLPDSILIYRQLMNIQNWNISYANKQHIRLQCMRLDTTIHNLAFIHVMCIGWKNMIPLKSLTTKNQIIFRSLPSIFTSYSYVSHPDSRKGASISLQGSGYLKHAKCSHLFPLTKL